MTSFMFDVETNSWTWVRSERQTVLFFFLYRLCALGAAKAEDLASLEIIERGQKEKDEGYIKQM